MQVNECCSSYVTDRLGAFLKHFKEDFDKYFSEITPNIDLYMLKKLNVPTLNVCWEILSLLH